MIWKSRHSPMKSTVTKRADARCYFSDAEIARKGNAEDQPRKLDNTASPAQKLRQQQPQLSGKDIKMATTVFAIVAVFLFCHTPRLFLNLYETFLTSTHRQGYPPEWFLCVISVSHLLLTINSSVNIIIYCAMGKKFRRGLYKNLHLCF